MITLFGINEDPSFEELGAIELLVSKDQKLQSLLPPSVTDNELGHANAFLSRFKIRAVRYSPGVLEKAGTVISFGRPGIFGLIRETKERPARVVYSSEDVSPQDHEVQALSAGLLDEVATKNTKYAAKYVRELANLAQKPVNHRFGYTPFCNPSSSLFKAGMEGRSIEQDFVILRDAPNVGIFAHSDLWRMCCGVTGPYNRNFSFRVLGWGDELSDVAGDPSSEECKWNGEVDAEITYGSPTWEETNLAYSRASALLHFYPAVEAFSFAAAKAMLAGVVVVGAPSPAFSSLIRHNDTGFLATTSDEAAYLTSNLIWEPHLRAKIAANAYNWFVTEGPGNESKCLPWWEPLLE